jgi:hypothetical protein
MRDNKAHTVWTKFARLPSIFVHTCFVKKKKNLNSLVSFSFLFFFFFWQCTFIGQIVDNSDNKYKKALMGPTCTHKYKHKYTPFQRFQCKGICYSRPHNVHDQLQLLVPSLSTLKRANTP